MMDNLPEHLNKMFKAREAIVAHIESTGRQNKSVRDVVPCPVCETGTLVYGYAGDTNRHINARCTTPGCTAWME